MDFSAFAVILGAFALGVGATLVFNWLVEKRAYSKYMREKSSQSNAKQSEKKERMGEAMARAVLIMKDENIPKEDKMKHLLNLAGEFPDVAFDVAKKVGINGLF